MKPALLLALALASAAHAADLNVKFLRPTLTEVDAQLVLSDVAHLTIGGVRPLFAPSVRFAGGRLSEFTFFFQPRQFEQVRDAIRAQGLALACGPAAAPPGAPAGAGQERCTAGTLTVERYSSSADAGSVYWSAYGTRQRDADKPAASRN